MIPVTSSNIKAVDYNYDRQEFDVEFRSGDIYRYFEIPKGIYEKFLLAKSKGQFFDIFVKKSNYRYEKLVVNKEAAASLGKQWEALTEQLEKAGVVHRDQDGNGNMRVVVNGDLYKEML